MNKPDTPMIERVLADCATHDEIATVLAWFKTCEGQQWLSQRMDQDAEEIAPGQEELWTGTAIPSDRMQQQIMHRIRLRRIRMWCMRAAAVLVPIMILVAGYMYVGSRVDVFAQSDYDEVTVPAGERMQMVFQDGTRVCLNSGSRIRYPKTFAFAERRVSLEGEAWFDVAKGESWPFVVDLKCMEVKVRGTSFNVRAYPGDSEIGVTLKEGLVDMNLDKKRTVTLTPGQRAIYDRYTDRCTVEKFNLGDTSAYDWRQSKLTFKDAPLGEVLYRLTQMYSVNFKITDPYLYRYTYTLTSREKDIHKILKELEKITPLQFSQQGDTIYVSHK